MGLDDKRIRKTHDKLRLPMLIIIGGKDYIVPVSKAKSFANEFEERVIKVYPEAGHPAYLYNKEKFIQDILEFHDKLKE